MPGPAPSPLAAAYRAHRPEASSSPYDARPWIDSYPDGVPDDFDFPSVPLTRLLDDATSSFPTGTALAFLGTRITYRELQSLVDRFATALAGLGVGKGDRVAIVLPNCPQNVITFFAALRLGAVVVQHNPLYTDAELRHQLADSGAKVVVCLDRVYDAIARVRADTALEHVVVTSVLDYLPRSTRLALRLPLASARRRRGEISARVPKTARAWPFLRLLRRAGTPARQAPLDPATDLALLQYTGGTTGLSKGAMLTHANLVSNAYMNRLWDTGATSGKEVTLGVLPLFHAYGLTVCMNATVLLGGTLVLLPRFDLDQVFAAIDTWKPTMFPGVPPIYKALTDSPKARSHDLRSIRVCVSGAMKLPAEVQEQFERISGARLVEGYGMTETSPSTHCNPLAGPRRTGSIGLPLPGTRCRIVDRDDAAREVPVGEPGELAIAGPQVFAGYWGRPDAEDVFTDDGYVLTGDIAVMDDDGYFTIVDRKKELIIAGGFNIYPSEVEEVLYRLPGVADCVVIGVPDRYRGETVKAYVVPQPGASLTEQDVIAHCAADLTAYKVPRIVEFREALPRTAVGKVLRRVLVAEEQARAAQNAAPIPGSVPTGFPRRDAEPATETPGRRAQPPRTEEPGQVDEDVEGVDVAAAVGGEDPREAEAEADDPSEAGSDAAVLDGEDTDTDTDADPAEPEGAAGPLSAREPDRERPAARRPTRTKPAPPARVTTAAVTSPARRKAAAKGGARSAVAARRPAPLSSAPADPPAAPVRLTAGPSTPAAGKAPVRRAAIEQPAPPRPAARKERARPEAVKPAAVREVPAEPAPTKRAAKQAPAKAPPAKAAPAKAAPAKAAPAKAAPAKAAPAKAAPAKAAPAKAAPTKAAPAKAAPAKVAPARAAKPAPPAATRRVAAPTPPSVGATARRAAPASSPQVAARKTPGRGAR